MHDHGPVLIVTLLGDSFRVSFSQFRPISSSSSSSTDLEARLLLLRADHNPSPVSLISLSSSSFSSSRSSLSTISPFWKPCSSWSQPVHNMHDVELHNVNRGGRSFKPQFWTSAPYSSVSLNYDNSGNAVAVFRRVDKQVFARGSFVRVCFIESTTEICGLCFSLFLFLSLFRANIISRRLCYLSSSLISLSLLHARITPQPLPCRRKMMLPLSGLRVLSISNISTRSR